MHIPGYQIERELGQGGMAIVYLAMQESLDRHVALKIIKPVLTTDEDFAARFLREGRLIASLSDTHIVTVYDIGSHDGVYYLSMEYLSGGTLHQRIRDGLPLRDALSITRAIARALHYAHSRNIIHRDIKPQNILFRENGSPVLTDFGIAKTLGGSTIMTRTGLSIGTPRYMSPEQIRGEKIDGRADLYSLGVLFHEMLTGNVPYNAEDSFALAMMHVTAPIPELPAHWARFQPFLNKLLSKDLAQRFQTGEEVIAALEVLDPHTGQTGAWDILVTTGTHSAKSPPRARWQLALPVAGLLAAAAATGGYLLWNQATEPTASTADSASTPATPSTTAEAAKRQRDADQLLAQATQLRERGTLNDSLARIDQGLQLVPDHAGLLAMHQQISEQIAGQEKAEQAFQEARQSRQEGALDTSLVYIEQGLRFAPQHAGLLALKRDVQEQQTRQRNQQEAEARQQAVTAEQRKLELARLRAQAEEQRQIEAQLRAQLEEQRRAEARARAEAEAQKRQMEQERRYAEAEAKRQAETQRRAAAEEERLVAEERRAEAQRRAEEQQRRAEQEERRLQAEEQRLTEAEEKRQARLRAQAEEKQRAEMEAEERRQAAAEAEEKRQARLRAQAEEKQRAEAEAEKRRQAAAEAEERRRAEAKLRAEIAEQRRTQERLQAELEEQRRSQEQLRAKAEQQRRAQAEAQARLDQELEQQRASGERAAARNKAAASTKQPEEDLPAISLISPSQLSEPSSTATSRSGDTAGSRRPPISAEPAPPTAQQAWASVKNSQNPAEIEQFIASYPKERKLIASARSRLKQLQANPALTVQLVVRSNQKGTTVLIDGNPAGVTPLEVNLSPGTHYVQVQREGYEDWSKEVVLTAEDEAVKLTVPLLRKRTQTAAVDEAISAAPSSRSATKATGQSSSSLEPEDEPAPPARRARASEKPAAADAPVQESAAASSKTGCVSGNCRSGEGTYRHTDGSEYTGQFRNAKMHGQGTYTYAKRGEKYAGEWRNNVIHGQGAYYYRTGNSYEGEWRNGRKNGQGTYSYANGEKYVGDFADDQPNGQGVYYYSDGSRYEGEWRDGQKNGQGTLYENGKRIVGQWQDDRKISVTVEQ